MRLCLVGHSARPLLGLPSGGSERQTCLLARHMARRGHDVTLVLLGQEVQRTEAQGVQLRSGWDNAKGMRFVRSFTYRYPNLRRVISDCDPDVIYMRSFSYHTRTVVETARRGRALSILALTSDRDLAPDSGRYHFGIGGSLPSRILGRLAFDSFKRKTLPRVDRTVVQNQAQERACREAGMTCTRLPSIVETAPPAMSAPDPTSDVIWVGNAGWENRRSKGLEDLAELASLLPQVSFTIVGDVRGPAGITATSDLKALRNVTLRGFRSQEETLADIASSRLVINTSPSEGFSNVILEGWSLARPAVTLSVDTDNLLSNQGLGACAEGDVHHMALLIRVLLADDELRAAMGDKARDYVTRVHAPDAVCIAFERLVEMPGAAGAP